MPRHKMLQAVHLIASSKKGISAHQLGRILEVQYKTAWFLAHRIREAMRSGDLAAPFGSGGGAVEVDETYFGTKEGRRGRSEEHTSALQSLMRISYAVICLKKKNRTRDNYNPY